MNTRKNNFLDETEILALCIIARMARSGILTHDMVHVNGELDGVKLMLGEISQAIRETLPGLDKDSIIDLMK